MPVGHGAPTAYAGDLAAGGRSRRRGFLIIATSAAIALCVASVVLLRWRNDLQVFAPVGNGVEADHLAIGHTVYFGNMLAPDGGQVELRITALRPVVTQNTSRATIRILMCTLPSGTDAGPGATYTLTGFCTSARHFSPTTYTVGYGPSPSIVSVVVAVTPHAPGHVHVAGLDVTYERGFRHGHQRTGLEIDTRTPPR